MGFSFPENGVTVEDSNKTVKTTNSSGLVTFTYRVAMEMNTERYYHPSPCEGKTKLPVDGQVYHFKYGVCKTDTSSNESEKFELPVDVQVYHSNYCVCIPEIYTYESENIAIKGPEPYTWERDVYPIFRQYYNYIICIQ